MLITQKIRKERGLFKQQSRKELSSKCTQKVKNKNKLN